MLSLLPLLFDSIHGQSAYGYGSGAKRIFGTLALDAASVDEVEACAELDADQPILRRPPLQQNAPCVEDSNPTESAIVQPHIADHQTFRRHIPFFSALRLNEQQLSTFVPSATKVATTTVAESSAAVPAVIHAQAAVSETDNQALAVPKSAATISAASEPDWQTIRTRSIAALAGFVSTPPMLASPIMLQALEVLRQIVLLNIRYGALALDGVSEDLLMQIVPPVHLQSVGQDPMSVAAESTATGSASLADTLTTQRREAIAHLQPVNDRLIELLGTLREHAVVLPRRFSVRCMEIALGMKAPFFESAKSTVAFDTYATALSLDAYLRSSTLCDRKPAHAKKVAQILRQEIQLITRNAKERPLAKQSRRYADAIEAYEVVMRMLLSVDAGAIAASAVEYCLADFVRLLMESPIPAAASQHSPVTVRCASGRLDPQYTGIELLRTRLLRPLWTALDGGCPTGGQSGAGGLVDSSDSSSAWLTAACECNPLLLSIIQSSAVRSGQRRRIASITLRLEHINKAAPTAHSRNAVGAAGIAALRSLTLQGHCNGEAEAMIAQMMRNAAAIFRDGGTDADNQWQVPLEKIEIPLSNSIVLPDTHWQAKTLLLCPNVTNECITAVMSYWIATSQFSLVRYFIHGFLSLRDLAREGAVQHEACSSRLPGIDSKARIASLLSDAGVLIVMLNGAKKLGNVQLAEDLWQLGLEESVRAGWLLPCSAHTIMLHMYSEQQTKHRSIVKRRALSPARSDSGNEECEHTVSNLKISLADVGSSALLHAESLEQLQRDKRVSQRRLDILRAGASPFLIMAKDVYQHARTCFSHRGFVDATFFRIALRVFGDPAVPREGMLTAQQAARDSEEAVRYRMLAVIRRDAKAAGYGSLNPRGRALDPTLRKKRALRTSLAAHSL